MHWNQKLLLDHDYYRQYIVNVEDREKYSFWYGNRGFFDHPVMQGVEEEILENLRSKSLSNSSILGPSIGRHTINNWLDYYEHLLPLNLKTLPLNYLSTLISYKKYDRIEQQLIFIPISQLKQNPKNNGSSLAELIFEIQNKKIENTLKKLKESLFSGGSFKINPKHFSKNHKEKKLFCDFLNKKYLSENYFFTYLQLTELQTSLKSENCLNHFSYFICEKYKDNVEVLKEKMEKDFNKEFEDFSKSEDFLYSDPLTREAYQLRNTFFVVHQPELAILNKLEPVDWYLNSTISGYMSYLLRDIGAWANNVSLPPTLVDTEEKKLRFVYIGNQILKTLSSDKKFFLGIVDDYLHQHIPILK